MVGGDEVRAGADGLAVGRDEANQLQPLGIGEAIALVHGRADELLLRRPHGTESEIAGRGAAVEFRARHVALLAAPGDRARVVEDKSVSVRCYLGGWRSIN